MGNVDTSIIGVFDPPRALRPSTAMVPPAPTQAPVLSDPPVAAPASQVIPPQPEKTPSQNNPNGGSDPPGTQNAGSAPQASPSGPPASGNDPSPTVTKGLDPQPGPNVKPSDPAPANVPVNPQPPSDPNDEPAGMMSALHQALGQNSEPNSQASPVVPYVIPQQGNHDSGNLPGPAFNQPAANPPATNQPAVNQPAPIQPPSNQPVETVFSSGNTPGSGSAGNLAGGNSQGYPNSGQSSALVQGATGHSPSEHSEPFVPVQGQGSNPSSNGPANSGSSQSGPPTVNQGPRPASAASSPPQFAVPVGNGEVLSGAVINPSSVIIAGPSGGATVQAGVAPTQVPGGHIVSVDPAASNIVIHGQEHALPTQDSPPNPEINYGNNSPAAVTPGSNPNTPPGGSAQNQPVAQPNSPAFQQNKAGPIPPAAVSAMPVATTIGDHVVAANPSAPGVVFVDGQSIPQGASPVVISNTPIAYHPNGDLVLGTSTVPNVFPTQVAPPAPLTTDVANHAIAVSPYSPNAVQIDGQTVSQGAEPVTLSGTPVAYHSNGDIIIGSSTLPNILPSLVSPQSPSLSTSIGNHLIANIPSAPNAILVDGKTISSGAQPVTISGTPVAYQGNGNLILGTTTISNIMPLNTYPPPSPSAPAVLTVNGQVATVLPNNAGINIAGTTILPNAPAVSISGTVSASFGSAGLIVGKSTVQIPSQALSLALQSQNSIASITLAGQVFTYAVSAPTPTPTRSTGPVVETSAVMFTSTGADGATFIGSPSSVYTSTLPASASGAQNVGGLILGGLGPSGPGNVGLNSANSTQGSPSLTSAAVIKGQTPASGSGRIHTRIYDFIITIIAIFGILCI